jgi:hypothetical protein
MQVAGSKNLSASKPFAILWCLVVALILGTCSYRFVSPEARAGRAIFNNLSEQDIRYISIEPAQYESLVSSPVVIRDKETIAAFAKALSRLPSHFPNHPNVTKAVVLRIGLRDGVIGGELRESSNNGTSFYYMSNVSTGWVFQTYLVPRSRGIFDLIQKVLSSRAAPNNSFKPKPLRGSA